jgi:hypothetical protein
LINEKLTGYGILLIEHPSYILLHVHPLLGIGLVKRQTLGKQSVVRLRNNRTNVYGLLLGKSQRANGLAG